MWKDVGYEREKTLYKSAEVILFCHVYECLQIQPLHP